MNARDMMVRARTKLVLDEPFFGALVLRLKLVEDASCATAWVDGVSLGYNPAFIETLSFDELVGVLAHEVMHCASGHPWRQGTREHERWNEAADRAINPVLRDAGFTLPEGVLFELDPAHGREPAEWIYDRLYKPAAPPQGGGQGQGQGAGQGQGQPQPGQQPGAGQGAPQQPQGSQGQGQPGGAPQPGQGQPGSQGQGKGQPQPEPCPTGEVRPAPAGADAEGAGEDDWKAATVQAANAAKGRGKLPGDLERFCKEAAKPRVDWRSVLRRFIQQFARADYSWRMPNPRYVCRGLYLPALRAEAMGPMIVAIDTSGSIDDVTLAQFAGEIESILDECKPERVEVIYCDARVRRTETIERGEPFVVTPGQGGGGTSFIPVFDAVAELDEQPACLVYLTDMDGSFPAGDPGYPVLWATIDERPAPFGEVVLCK